MSTSQVASGSSTTLWATASKEWTIPPKPKPGRKPKKEAAVAPPVKVDTSDEVDSKGRRVQNRAAQRAFRERKQSQLAELQARVEKYEQGEIERNVALQNISKRLKEENEQLRAENKALHERIAVLEREQQERQQQPQLPPDTSVTTAPRPPTGSPVAPKKRGRNRGSTSPAVAKRAKLDPPATTSLFAPAYGSTPPAMIDSPNTNFSLSPEPMALPEFSNQDDGPILMPTFDCGFCNEDTPCVCREIAMQTHGIAPTLKNEDAFDSAIIVHHEQPPAPSILDNLPAFQPAVPLPRRNKAAGKATRKEPLFQIVQPAPTCSGDPSNCSACKDDTFGQAFCAAVGESVAAISSSSSSIPPSTGRCADCPGNCGFGESSSSAPVSLSASTTIPTNAAWHQIKSHPKVAFTDLALLADVVARRSKCTGPRVVISPAPGSTTPERELSANADNGMKREPSPPPRLVPEEVLIECGRQRVREVEISAVKDALRLLDAKYGTS